MAFELIGMLGRNVSPMTGEHIKPAYGGDKEAFLTKVVTPIYDIIAMVRICWPHLLWHLTFFLILIHHSNAGS